MKKKSLLTLLVLPLILSGCGGSEPEKPKPGERGEDVLTAAQKERMLTLDGAQDYTLGVALASEKVVDSDRYLLEWYNEHFFIYRHDGGTEHPTDWVIVSKEAGQIDVATKGYGYTGPDELEIENYGTISDGTTGIPFVYYYAHFESSSYKNTVNTVKDAFGNTIFNSNEEYDDFHFNSASLSKDADKNYILTVNYYDNGITTSKRLVYGEGFKGLKAEEVDPYASLTKSQEYYFTVENVKYTVGLTNGKEYYVSHSEGGEIVTKYYPEQQQGNKVLVGQYLIYQDTDAVNVHEGDYDLVAYNQAMKINTYRLNLATGKTEKIEFPYIIQNFSHEDFVPEDLKENEGYDIPKYAVATLYAIENKQLNPVGRKYVLDADLVLHDELTAYETNYKKLGENHYLIDKVIYDSNYKIVGDLSRFNIITTYPKGILVQETATGSNRYGFVGEDGKFVLEPQYLSANAGYNPPVVNGYLKLRAATNEYVYFDPYGLKLITYTRDAEREYVYNSSNTEFFCLKGAQDKEDPLKYGDDEFYFINTKLATVKHFESSITWSNYSYKQNDSTYLYRCAQFTDADGDIVRIAFVSSMVAIEE